MQICSGRSQRCAGVRSQFQTARTQHSMAMLRGRKVRTPLFPSCGIPAHGNTAQLTYSFHIRCLQPFLCCARVTAVCLPMCTWNRPTLLFPDLRHVAQHRERLQMNTAARKSLKVFGEYQRGTSSGNTATIKRTTGPPMEPPEPPVRFLHASCTPHLF